MTHNQITGDNILQLVELDLILREQEDGAPFARKLSQRDNMVLVVRNEKCELVTQTQKGTYPCLIVWNREISQRVYA